MKILLVFIWRNKKRLLLKRIKYHPSPLLSLFGPHDKTNKMSVRTAKTRISLGICQVWSESSLSPWRNLGSLATHILLICSTASLGPGQMPSLMLGAQSFCWLCHKTAHLDSNATAMILCILPGHAKHRYWVNWYTKKLFFPDLFKIYNNLLCTKDKIYY